MLQYREPLAELLAMFPSPCLMGRNALLEIVLDSNGGHLDFCDILQPSLSLGTLCPPYSNVLLGEAVTSHRSGNVSLGPGRET